MCELGGANGEVPTADDSDECFAGRCGAGSMMRQRVVAVLTCVLLAGGWLSATPAAGADLFNTAPPPVEAPAVDDSLRRVQMVKTEQPPIIDGRLSDTAWGRAAVLPEFTQAFPNAGAPPSARTEVRLLFDADYVYIGVRAFDSEPEKIIAKERQRDIAMDQDDFVAVALDPFHDRRRGYYFQVNAVANRRDGLITPHTDTENGGLQIQFEWDGIWHAEAVIDEQGWTAELAIPMKTISFDPDQTTWGFNVERVIPRRNETMRWTAATRTKQVVTMGDAGNLEGLTGLRQGLGIDLVPYAKFTGTRETPGGNDTFLFKPGGDLYYKVTPSVTAALTVNTDFAETEVDDRRVNLTRFPLFFPEKRRFFNQDANYFKFAGTEQTPLPFFSRRIGLGLDRTPIDLLAGVKVTGQVGRVNFGLLSVQADKTDGLNSKNLSVGRASMGIFDESSIGVVFTHGNPASKADNLLGGADLTLKSSNFLGTSQVAELDAYVMRSEGEGQTGNAFGAKLLYPNFTWDAGLTFGQSGATFNPALGFIDLAGTRDYKGWVGRSWRPAGLDSVRLGLGATNKTTLDNRTIQGVISLPELRLTTTSQDGISAGPILFQEQYFVPFEIAPGVMIPSGNYTYLTYYLALASAPTRAVSGSIEVGCCEYVREGRRMDLDARLVWRPSTFFNLGATYSQVKLDLPDGKFTVHIGQLNLNMTLTRNLSWNLVGQYDNVSHEFGLNSRMRWAVQPGSDLFLVFNHHADTERGWHSNVSELSTKLGWTFRF
ncbi:MAG: hypothetical protein E8D46_14325 [Nitrospira sp.]|nr:MAG: hypothetical protein E8D46_14325 [Nitrospira sp.]